MSSSSLHIISRNFVDISRTNPAQNTEHLAVHQNIDWCSIKGAQKLSQEQQSKCPRLCWQPPCRAGLAPSASLFSIMTSDLRFWYQCTWYSQYYSPCCKRILAHSSHLMRNLWRHFKINGHLNSFYPFPNGDVSAMWKSYSFKFCKYIVYRCTSMSKLEKSLSILNYDHLGRMMIN